MLKNITHKFPQTTAGTDFLEALTTLFSGLPNVINDDGKLTVTATQPEGASPSTIFTLDKIPFPEVQFGIKQDLQLKIADLRADSKQIPNDTTSRLPMSELYKKLNGHVTRLDHTGVNIPSISMSKDNWRIFTGNIAKITNLYRYPTGEPWLFIVPATESEFKEDISEFPIGREPRCELVHDAFSTVPTLQIDLETDLSRTEIEQLFPEPYGFSFPDLADYFRSIYVDHEWDGLNIRFDLRFKNDNPGGDWETGKWLVEDGGRLS